MGYCAAYFLIALVCGAACVRTQVDHQLEHFSAPAVQLDIAAQQDQSRTETAAKQEAINIFAKAFVTARIGPEDVANASKLLESALPITCSQNEYM